MTKKTNEEIIAEMQIVAQQMVKDDLDENPDLADEYFECDCCGKTSCMAGSIQYDKYRLCNDCVLLAETGFALKKFNNIQALIDAMEDNRLEEFCNYIKSEEARSKQINN
ncbi:hypothetical protein IJ579_04700 [bacterium]|nr:hypothetical protein [bacterium]